jgi:hypothetical protein
MDLSYLKEYLSGQATPAEESSTSIVEEMFETVEKALLLDGDTPTSEEKYSKRKERSQSRRVVAYKDPPGDKPQQQKAEFVIPRELHSMDSYFEDVDVENQVSGVGIKRPSQDDDADETPAHETLSIKKTFSSLAERLRSIAERTDPALQDAPSVESEETGNSHSSGTASTDGSSSEEGVKFDADVFQELTEIPLNEDADGQKKSESSRGRSPTRRTHKTKSSKKEEEKHISLFGHGRLWTLLAIMFSWSGFAFAFFSRSSTEFVTMDIPIYVDPVFDTVSEIGLINLRLCYNESFIDRSGCTIHELGSDDVNDRMFQISRSLIFVAILFGGFLSSCLSASVCWSSINLRPIGVGYLITYFLQSFSFLFFDSDLCAEHQCHLGRGCLFSIVASICWLASGIAASRMDITMHKKKRRIRRRQRSLKRSHTNSALKKSKLLEREVSNVTAKTEESVQVVDCIQDKEASRAWKARQVSQPSPAKRTQATSVPTRAPKAERLTSKSSRPRASCKEEVGLGEFTIERIQPTDTPTVSKVAHHQSTTRRSTLEVERSTFKVPAGSRSAKVSRPPSSKKRPPSTTLKTNPQASPGTSCRTPSSKERSHHSSASRTKKSEAESSRSRSRPPSSRAKTSAASKRSSSHEQRLKTRERSRSTSRPASKQSSSHEQRLQTRERSRSTSRPASSRTKSSAPSSRQPTY